MADRYVDYVPVTDVKQAPRNPKQHDATGIGRSIGHFGVAEVPLLDERTGCLVAGHGRHDHVLSLHGNGSAPPDGIQVADDGTWLMPVIRGWSSRSDDDAEAYLVASNRLTQTGGWDERMLTEVLGDLGEAQMLELTGFAADDLDALEALARADGAEATDEEILAETDRAGWPVIRAQVPPDVYERWEGVDGDDDAERVLAVLELAGL
ncbi:MAG: hypothetical protein GEU83_11945 [Pseudonocardiaceae bacterium]|nr:hypothetical protein [Pseudonocardiaceae bacterium]